MLKKLSLILTFIVVFACAFSIKSNAATVPYDNDDIKAALDSIDYTYENFIIVYDNIAKSSYKMYVLASTQHRVSNDTFYAYTDYPLTYIRFNGNDDYRYYALIFNWDINEKAFVANGGATLFEGSDYAQAWANYGIVDSQYNVLGKEGQLFFQQTLPMEETTNSPILVTIMEMVPTVVEKIVETLKILVPFGVGLLASWIGLKILLMVLYKFL